MEDINHSFSIKFIIPAARLKNAPEDSRFFIESDKNLASTIPGLTYWISINPRDDRRESRNQTQIFLDVSFKDLESVTADYEFTIKSTHYKRSFSHVFNESTGHGPYICSYENLMNPARKWIVDGHLTLEIIGTFFVQVPSGLVRIQSKNLSFSSLWNRFDKDFTFFVGNKTFKVHKPILGNACKVFDQMLETDWKETAEGRCTIEDFDHDTVGDAIQYIYGKPIATTYPKAFKLLQFADMYDITDLKNELENCLIGKITNLTAVQFANASLLTNAQKLRQKCFDFLFINFGKTYISNIEELDPDFKDEFMAKAFSCNINP